MTERIHRQAAAIVDAICELVEVREAHRHGNGPSPADVERYHRQAVDAVTDALRAASGMTTVARLHDLMGKQLR